MSILAFYECVFITRQDISSSALNSVIDRFQKIVDDNKSKVHETEVWGLKNLAYKIKKNRKGNFVMMAVEGSGAAISELERNFRIEEDVIRYLTIKVKKFNEGPSIMMLAKENNSVSIKSTANETNKNVELQSPVKEEKSDVDEKHSDTKESLILEQEEKGKEV